MTDWVRTLDRLLEPRFHGPVAWLPTLVAVVTGVIFVSFGIGKFVEHASEAVDFERYEVPLPSLAVYVAGVVETLGGVLLIIGLFTRLAAAALALQMVAVVATAGRVEGGFLNLGVAPMLFVAMVFLVWSGPGALSVDRRLNSSRRTSGRRS
jgi:putative oxidoreductase